MSTSRCLQLSVLLALGAPVVGASEPMVAFGAGTGITCKANVQMVKDKQATHVADMVFSWVQGYFTARNTVGHGTDVATVGGTMSSETLQSMLVDQCKDPASQPFSVMIAAEALYEKLESKGL